MKWSEIPRDPKALRQFAGAWLVCFVGGAVWQGLVKDRPQLATGLALMGIVGGVGGLIRPVAIRWLFVGSLVLAFPMGWLISQLTLLLIFYGLLTPIALFFRLTRRDALCRQLKPDVESYWNIKEQPEDRRRYFRQY